MKSECDDRGPCDERRRQESTLPFTIERASGGYALVTSGGDSAIPGEFGSRLEIPILRCPWCGGVLR